jgi:SAM-dependent methyltransferase
LYEALQVNPWYYVSDKPEFGIAADWLPNTGSVLEVGAGSGAFATYVGVDRYTGLEFNAAAIAEASRKGVSLRRETIESHAAVQPGRYAAVVSFQVLEHVSAPASFIRSCVESLQDGGVLVFAVPDHEGLCGEAHNNILDLPPHHLTHWTAAVLTNVAKLFSLELTALIREPLAAIHVDWAARTSLESRIRRFLGLDRRLLDLRFRSRIAARLAVEISRRVRRPTYRYSGHSIVAVYRKR